MEAIRVQTVVQEEGEVTVSGLPLERGQRVELIVLVEPREERPAGMLTARRLRRSPLVGLWHDRTEIGDSAEYARQLRQEAQERQSTR
jgi:hypothetical protein